MTIEKYKAICRAGMFLEKMMYQGDYDVKKEARMLLRHFPDVVELAEIFKGKESQWLSDDEWQFQAYERDRYRERWKK